MKKEVTNLERFAFNPVRDIQPVDQTGFVDLREAFINGSLPGDLHVPEQDYNGVVDPSSLIGRPSDTFDAIRKANYVKSAESAAVAAAEAKAKAASSAASE